jgi:hypothetical protein
LIRSSAARGAFNEGCLSKNWIYNMGYRFIVFYEYGKADFVAFEQ